MPRKAWLRKNGSSRRRARGRGGDGKEEELEGGEEGHEGEGAEGAGGAEGGGPLRVRRIVLPLGNLFFFKICVEILLKLLL